MVRRNGLIFLGMGLLTGALVVGSGTAGCQSDTTTSSGPGGSGGSGASSSTTNSGGSTGGGTPTSSSSSSGTGGTMAQVVTIEDVTTNKVGPQIPVKLEGVVAMSQKFLVSKGSQSGSCLWGIFVSSPGIAETKENSGIMVVSYGSNAVVQDGGQSFCPKLGSEPIGDAIPDGTKPGDVLDVLGETSYFLLSQCATQPMGSTVAQYQIAKVSSVTKTGTAAVPTAHVLSGAELASLAAPGDKAFHDKWGGVKVKVSGPVIPQAGMVVGMYGIIQVDLGNGAAVNVADKIYYQAYNKAVVCHAGPVYADVNTTFTGVEGFSMLDFCTWDIQPNSKCDDLAPPSDDCAGMSCN